MRKLSILLIFITTLQSAIAQNGKEAINLTDLLKIKTVGNVTLTKDGSKAAFTVTVIEADENNKLDYKYLTQIYSASPSNTSPPLQLTTSKEGATKPAWSPDGKQLAFTRMIDDNSQIFILSTEGGEPIQLTSHKYGANNPKWSPDGKKIMFSSNISFQELLKDSTLNKSFSIPTWTMEKPGFDKNEYLLPNKARLDPDGSLSEIRAYLDKNATDKKAIVLHKLNFQNESVISSEMNFTHFFDINTTANAKPRLLTKGFYSFTNAEYTPDGKQIVFSGNIDSTENPDRSLESEIYIADSDGGNFKMILGEKDKKYSNASVSHSGKWLAFLYSNTSFISVPTLAIIPLNGTQKDIKTFPFDRNKTNLTWSKDDKYLYFTGQSNGGNILNRLNINTKNIEPLSSSEVGITSFDISNNTLVYSKTQVSNPSELYFSNTNFKKEKKGSDFNNWLLNKKLSFPEKKTFINDIGMTIEYWVMKPTQYQEGEKYPLLLEIHGGPSAMWGPGEESMWHEYQYFCSKGYGVVYSNPRGSGGYGLDFLRGNVNDWGKGPSSDVLTALDKTIDQGWADPSKLLITGGSYAGYLTAWIISHDNRFKAACAQRGVYDLTTFFGEGNAWRLVPNYFGGYPWEPKVKEILIRESPLTYVENIKTPFIIFHGGNDRRTGFVQGEMMFRSLKVLGRPVEYVVHPGATHEITRNGDNRQRMDQMLRTFEFFERWLNKNKDK
ncbi:S9 family peptidase [Flavobacterium sp. LB2P44]|uniref:S9 family peptidase n=1 Tax=Flavobacterium sp. LB2P44 TaxID=3401713 RepID=UPI003AAAC4E3